MLGALVFAELAARRPVAGGGYVYLRDAYGRLPAFLYAWTLLLVIATGAIAAVAVTFASYMAALLGFGPAARLPLAVGAILLLSAINYVGVKPGAVTQNVLTVLKLAALAILIIAGLTLAPSQPPQSSSDRLHRAGSCLRWRSPGTGPLCLRRLATTNFVAEELIEPERNLPRALVAGVSIVVAVYLFANLAYLRTLGIAAWPQQRSSRRCHERTARPAGPAPHSPRDRHFDLRIPDRSSWCRPGSIRQWLATVSSFPASRGCIPGTALRRPPSSFREPGESSSTDRPLRRPAGLRVLETDLLRGSGVDRVRVSGAGAERTEPSTLGFDCRLSLVPIAFVLAALYVVVGSIASNPERGEGHRAHPAGGAGVSVLEREGGKGKR